MTDGHTFVSASASVHSPRVLVSAMLALLLVACGDTQRDDASSAIDSPNTASNTASSANVAATQAGSGDAAIGTMVLGDTTYEFRVRRCDLTGNSPDGMLLTGTGTAPDGRRLTVEVERLSRSETTQERATIYFGSIVDGDHWTARRTGPSGPRLLAGTEHLERDDGLLLQVSGADLLVEHTFTHETKDSSQTGVLRATCAA